ncbi:hypothetical protein Bxe_C0954 [Paraburkholderia xenovorans LB400]|uniref:Uncharacterized protein n=1 Tax=Paraburkholderia xenovorans (strain LB400) TaxID=266265 RepID=Q13GG0_PARXL|nr:hypothetical protein Bxe_C0954 [Paraburkholderia xenovorans LB400]
MNAIFACAPPCMLPSKNGMKRTTDYGRHRRVLQIRLTASNRILKRNEQTAAVRARVRTRLHLQRASPAIHIHNQPKWKACYACRIFTDFSEPR